MNEKSGFDCSQLKSKEISLDNHIKSPLNKSNPFDRPSPLSQQYFNWRAGMVGVIGLLLILTFLNTLVTNPIVTGYAVASDEIAENNSRFSGVTSLLLVVFLFFGLFLVILTKKMMQKTQV